jgi:hypothetical protein
MAKRCIELHSTNIAQLPQHNFAETPFFLVEGEFVEYGFAVVTPPEIEFKPDFPDCCDYHAGILAQETAWFDRFPDCCRWHKELVQKPWFDRSKYLGRPWKILMQLCYTTHHIYQKINASDWFDDISEYIDYNLASFGSPAVGATQYLAQVERVVRGGTEDFWTTEKRERLLAYIEQQENPDVGARADLNLLHTTFQKWLQAIPVLDAFAALKESLTGKVPVGLMLHSPQHNRYLGQTAYRAHTRREFVGLLFDLTKSLLADVQSADQMRNGEIADVRGHHLHLLGEQHRLRQSRLVENYTKGEDKYLKLLKNWLRNEQAYFAALLPLFSTPVPDLPPTKQTALTPPTVPAAQKIKKLQTVLERATAFEENNAISAAFTAWKDFTARTLGQLYGESSFEATKFNVLRFAPRAGLKVVPNTPDHHERKRKAFRRDIHIAIEALKSYLADATDEMNTVEQTTASTPLQTTPVAAKRLFISHASKDAPIVEELLDILGLLGLGSEHIFCSSVAGYGIPLGENFYERLKTELTSDVLVLFMLSANFFQSPVCLCEMGAAWVLTKKHVPILIPPTDFSEMKGVIPATQGFKLTEKLKINELAQVVAQHFQLPTYSQNPDWERKRDKSLAQIEALVARQGPIQVT